MNKLLNYIMNKVMKVKFMMINNLYKSWIIIDN